MPTIDLHGVFVGAHAVSEGRITRRQLRALPFRRLTAGVYADPGLAHDHQLYCRGVGLVLPRGTAVGALSAASWHGAPHASVVDPVRVVRATDVRWNGRRGIDVHGTDLGPEDVEVLDDVPVTTALRTAWDVAVLERLPTAVAAVDAMLRARSVGILQLGVMVERSRGRWGVTRVRRVLDLVDARAESPPESWVRVAFVLAGLDPVPQFEVYAGSRFVARVDLAWPEFRVAVEYEGPHHFDPEQVQRDRERLAALEAAGWIVIRLAASDLRDMAEVVRRVRDVLGLRAHLRHA